MKNSLSIGEVNNRILLSVRAINTLIDYELTLDAMQKDLSTLQKYLKSYSRIMKASEDRAYELRAKYAKQAAEVESADLTRAQLELRLAIAQRRQLDTRPSVLTLLLSACYSPSTPSPPAVSPVEPTPETDMPHHGYLHKLKQHWRRMRQHWKADTPLTLRRAEARLVEVSAVLAAKRVDGLRVQRAMRATRENISIARQEICALQKQLSVPPWHIYEDTYHAYCELLQTKLVAAADTGAEAETEFGVEDVQSAFEKSVFQLKLGMTPELKCRELTSSEKVLQSSAC